MTKYRTINNGYTDILQYFHERKFLLFFTRKSWEDIWRPYYHRTYGRSMDLLGYDTRICRYNTNIESFVAKWPNIEDYFEWANKEQCRLENIVHKQNAEIDKKRGKIEYL